MSVHALIRLLVHLLQTLVCAIMLGFLLNFSLWVIHDHCLLRSARASFKQGALILYCCLFEDAGTLRTAHRDRIHFREIIWVFKVVVLV